MALLRVALIFALFFLTACKRVEVVQEKWDDSLLLNRRVSQTFLASQNGLNLVKVLANDETLQNHDEFVFTLRRGNAEEVLRELRFNGANVGANFVLGLKFEPVTDSAGQIYTFTLENLSQPGAGLMKQPLTIRYHRQNQYEPGRLSIDGAEQSGDLAFLTYYYLPPRQWLGTALNEFLTRAVQDKVFWLAYLGLLTGVVGWLGRSSRSDCRSSQGG